MVTRVKYTIASVLFIAITALSVMLISSCRKPRQAEDDHVTVGLPGAPAQYSATVIRTNYDGTNRETHVTSEAQSGEMRREEWTERDLHRAVIWRPDQGKSFLLDLDRREYVALDVTASHVGAGGKSDFALSSQGASDVNPGDTIQAIDRYFDDSQSPSRLETRILPAVVIDGHSCKVYEQRSIFLDGHIEITRQFRAEDLEGLPLRIECESAEGGVRITTERRDVSLIVPTDSFVVPPDFKRIERLR